MFLQDDLEDCRQRQQATEEVGDATIAGPSPPLPSPLALGVQMSGSKGAIDMFGNMVQPVALEQVKCPNCGRTLAAGRFAPHLDKCMMGRGRQASRGVKRFYDGDT